VSWCWVELGLGATGLEPGLLVALPLIALSMMLSSHTFPPMAWHTVDGILLASLGFFASRQPSLRSRLPGYVLLGASALCKQNFLALLPLGVILNRDAGRVLAWLATLLPAVAYVTIMSALGAGPDMRQQLLALTGLKQSGITPYIGAPWWAGGAALGGLAAWFHRAGNGAKMARGKVAAAWPMLGLVLVWLMVAALGRQVNADRYLFLDRYSFVLLGCVCGFTVVSGIGKKVESMIPVAAFAVGLAWCSGISKGYQTPAHASGPLATVLVMASLSCLAPARGDLARRAWSLGACAAALVILPCWWSARHDRIYNELAASALTARLDGVLPGGVGIRTNPNTFEVLADLNQAIGRVGARQYAVVEDVAGWWACSKQRNPLPADWPQSFELCTGELRRRFSASALALRGRTTFIVQKVYMSSISYSFDPVGDDNFYYGAVVWIRAHLKKTGETRFWDVYE